MGLRAQKISAAQTPTARAECDDGALLEEQDVLSTLEREYLDGDESDPIRGIANGILGGVALWAAAIAVFLILT